jgi:hypothetical protein
MATSAETNWDVTTERTRVGGVSALVAAVALVVSATLQGFDAGLQGTVGAVVVLAAWYLSGPTHAFTLGNIALVSVLPKDAVGQMVVVEAGLLGMLLAFAATLDGPDHSARSGLAGVLLVLAWSFAGGAFAWAVARSGLAFPVAGGLLIALFALAAYILHRYQLVSLGIVGEAPRGETGE